MIPDWEDDPSHCQLCYQRYHAAIAKMLEEVPEVCAQEYVAYVMESPINPEEDYSHEAAQYGIEIGSIEPPIKPNDSGST